MMAWSGGKDSAMALARALLDESLEVVGLLTTISLPYDRVTMHGVRRGLVQRQAERIGLPLHIVWLPPDPSHEVYDNIMGEAMLRLKATGVEGVIFGDISLTDVRSYRESRMAEVGMGAIFPLWDENTSELVEKFLTGGYNAVVTCVDTKVLSEEFCGQWLDAKFFSSLPETVDPCGENGEFHSFVTYAPFFSTPIKVQVGEKVQRGQFVYCELEETG
ncbi:MAG: diphthine--ammonia ligase [Candidatus Fervidibacter sp.]|uniref:Dph6-related ATP pyrophosphatase n=1 Tax=Candidatus Fervidibacter sp. TaxID=3100871 RepID=UPI00404B1360